MTIQHGSRGGRKTPLGIYLWRFASGAPLDGVRRTNATFIHRASRDLTDHGHASRWAHKPGYHRALWRMGATVVTVAILYGFIVNEPITADSLLGALAGLVIGGAVRARYVIARAKHHKRLVRPLYETATMITGASTVHAHAHGDDHKRYLTIPRNYRNNPDARIRLTVPPTWEGRSPDVKRLNDLFAKRLGGQWDIAHMATAYPPYVELRPSPSPPGKLTFTDIKRVLDAGNQNRLIIGKGTHDSIIDIDLDSDAPHVALSMGTGGGKSSLLRLIVAYLIHHGVERVDIIDPKRVSHNWAKGIPGVYIHTTMAKQMQALAEFRKRMEVRYTEMEQDETRVFPRHVLVIEEQNSWTDYAKTYWEDYRAELDSAERGRTPRRNPAIGDLAYALFQGRQARMNIISVFQSMSASAAGGRDMRENYGCRLLCRYSPQTWAMLVGSKPVPRSSRVPGRGRIVLGGEDREVQFAFITEDEAIMYALAGIPADARAGSPLISVSADGAGSDEPTAAMSLREMCDAGIIPMRYSTAKRARTRAGSDFPQGEPTPVGTLYAPAAVLAWHESRKCKSKSTSN